MPYTKFNGHLLKDLPEEAKQYKYLLLRKSEIFYPHDNYYLHCSDQPFMKAYGMVSVWPYLYNSNVDVNHRIFHYSSGTKEWDVTMEEETLEKGSKIDYSDGDGLVWANYDVMRGSTVELAASEPIPMPYVRIVDPLDLYTIVKHPNGFGIGTCMVFVERAQSGNRHEWTADMYDEKSWRSCLIRDSETGFMLTILLDPSDTATSVELVADHESDGSTFRTRKTFQVVTNSVSNGGDSSGGDSGDIEDSLITNIELLVHPNELSPGGRAIAGVIVSGTGDYSRDFTAEISENTSSSTCFAKGSSYHNIFVGTDETAEYILVTVTSVQDPTMTATEMIYINHSGTDDGIGDAEQLQLAYWKGYSAAKAMYGGGK